MAQKLQFSSGPFKAACTFDSEFEEWKVRFYSDDGSHITGADYFTDDKNDAIQTAQSEVKRMNKEKIQL